MSAAPKPPALATALKGRHAHGCLNCHRKYTDGCAEPLRNARCRDCLGAITPRASWDQDNDPIACCYRGTRPATAAERRAMRLGGPEGATWWICLTCWRQHPARPVEDL